jgi:hypothetical protein
MVNWMITGSGKNKPTKFGGGAGACKTAFKTRMKIKTPSGQIKPNRTVNSEYVWEDISPGDTIEYVVETGADKKKAKSDEFYIMASSLNWSYIISVFNHTNMTATPAQKKEWDANPQQHKEYLESQLDPSRLMLTIMSKIENTDSSGRKYGTLTIPSVWASGPIQIAFLYGYDKDLRTGDTSRIWASVFDAATWVALAATLVLFIACVAVTGGLCASLGAMGISGYLATGTMITIAAVDVAEIGKLVYDQYHQGFMANIGRNKYDCSFPEGGFAHIYNIVLNNPQNDPHRMIDVQAAQSNPASIKGGHTLLTARNLALIVGSVGLFMVISNVVGE